ncbi:MAG: MBL fold metallo-hydrolase [Acidiferrobacterales bacterium]
MRIVPIAAFTLFLISGTSSASTSSLALHEVTEGVYAFVGELGQRSETNLGNNATFGAVITKDGVVLIDAGGTRNGAKLIHDLVKTITDKPVVMVINTGGQDQRWMGNDYFKQLGAKIVASGAAVNDQKARFNDQITALENLVGKKGIAGTKDVYADQTFQSSLDLDVGGVQLLLRHSGPAHTPGDTYVWLPEKKVVFTGDIVYTERILVVGPMSNSRSWVNTFKEIEMLNPLHVVPGHGKPTTMQKAREDTHDYLVMLRGNLKKFADEGGSMANVASVDQSEFSYLQNYDLAKGRNAERVFLELEWE